MVSALNLNSTTGAYLVGVFFEIWLFGFTSLQAWYYFQHYPSDPFRLKGLVTLIWFLECGALLPCGVLLAGHQLREP